MKSLCTSILCSRRKRLFGSRPIFEKYEPESDFDLGSLESKHDFTFPEDLRFWLNECGFGDLDQQLSIRADWINVIDRGELTGHVIFAQDDLGNFYCFENGGGPVHYLCRSAPEYAPVADSFQNFIQLLVDQDFNIEALIETLTTALYSWDDHDNR